MARLGLPFAEVESFAEGVKRLPQIEVEGVFSHLASSEVLDDEGTRRQIERFETALRTLADARSASAAAPSCQQRRRGRAPGYLAQLRAARTGALRLRAASLPP